MIHIFHGDDQFASRNALNLFLDQNQDSDIFRVDSKTIDLDKINNFVNGQSLFATKKILSINNFFSIPKAILDKLSTIIQNSNSNIDIAIWQDKTLNQTQLKNFPKADVKNFLLDKLIFVCLNNIRPKNTTNFLKSFKKVIQKEPFELFLFWLRTNIRKQLTGFSKFEPKLLQQTYTQLIELDYQNKTGQLNIPKELALERILIDLVR